MWKFLTNKPKAQQLWSPNGLFLATVSPPKEVWGNSLADIAFWQKAAAYELKYFRHDYVAHAVQEPAPLVFVCWSSCGKWAIFYEFKRQVSYKLVFLNLAADTAYEVEASDQLINRIASLVTEQAILETIHANSPQPHPMYKDVAYLDSDLKP